MTQTKTAPPAAPGSAQGGLKPGLNPTIGAPIHKDLYRVKSDQELEKQEKIKQTRILGLGFFVVFFLIIGGLSLTLNGAWKDGLAVSMASLPDQELPGWEGEGEAKLPNARAKDMLARPPVVRAPGGDVFRPFDVLDFSYTEQDDVEPSAVAGMTPIHIWQERTLIATGYAKLPPAGAKARQTARKAVLRADASGSAKQVSELAQGVTVELLSDTPKGGFMQVKRGEESGWIPSSALQEPTPTVKLPNLEPRDARPALVNALFQAKLLRTVPTRYLMAVGLILGALALVVPVLMIPFYDFWMRWVTAPLGWFNTRLILGVVWVLLFTPVAIVRRLFAPDALRRQTLPKDQSYWLKREKQRDHKHFARGF